MKVLKEQKLFEEEISEVNPKNDSIADIADAVKTEIEDATNGDKTITDNKAKEVAVEIKNVARDADISNVAVVINKVEDSDYICRNRVTDALDNCLQIARENIGDRSNHNANLLLSGLPGSGKTAIVEAWARHNNLVLVPLNSTDPKIEAVVNGMPLRNAKEGSENAIVYAYATDKLAPLLDPSNKGKCVLFVDEFNRQADPGLRRAFLSLFNEKRNADGALNFRDTLLFTVVCINPAIGSDDKGAARLTDVELDRFANILKNVDSNKKDSLEYLKYDTALRLARLGLKLPIDYKEIGLGNLKVVDPTANLTIDDRLKFYKENRLDRILYIYAIGSLLFDEDSAFNFGTKEDRHLAVINGEKIPTTRSMTDGLWNAITSSTTDCVHDFLDWTDNKSNFTKTFKDKIHATLDGEIISIEDLREQVGIHKDGTRLSDEEQKLRSLDDNDIEDDTTIENDAATFSGSYGTQQSQQTNSSSQTKSATDAIDDLKKQVDSIF